MRESDFITLYRMHVTRLLESMDALEALRREYDALDYGNELDQEEHFVGENEAIEKAHLVSAVSTVETIGGLLAQGHRTNLYRVRQ